MRYAPRYVAAQLGFKRRVRLYDSAPERTRTARLSPLVVPFGIYWAACGLVCYAVLSGSLPLGRLLEGELTGERKATARSPARRVRTKPVATAPPIEKIAVRSEPIAEPASLPNPVEAPLPVEPPALVEPPPPVEPPSPRAFHADLREPPKPTERPRERSAPEGTTRQPIATLQRKRLALESEVT